MVRAPAGVRPSGRAPLCFRLRRLSGSTFPAPAARRFVFCFRPLWVGSQIAELAKEGASFSSSQRESKQLGLWPDDRRGAPNVSLRSALFSAAKPSKERKLYRDHALPAAIGTKTITYTGPQLYQYEQDVWLEVLHRCRLRPAGDATEFHPHGFLRSLRRSTGKANYRQLHETMAVLHATSINIIVERDDRGRPTGYRGHLIEKFRYNDSLCRWEVGLHPDIAELFAPKEHTWLDIDARLALGKNYLAKWCHGWFSSHRKPYPVSVERLRTLSGSSTAELFRFRSRGPPQRKLTPPKTLKAPLRSTALERRLVFHT